MGQVIVERGTAGHFLHQCGELGFRIELASEAPRVEEPVIPVIPTHERVDLERIARVRGENGAHSLVVVDPERFPIATTTDFHVATTANVIVFKGVEWEQDADPTIRLRMQQQEVTIVFRARIHPHPVAPSHVTTLVEPNLNRCLRLGHQGRLRGRNSERCE
jgi:hypothetical protein